jgi:hypothetical protein
MKFKNTLAASTLAVMLGFSASVSALQIKDIAELYPEPVALKGESLACDLPEHAFLFQEGYLIAQKAGVENAWYKTMFSELMDTQKCGLSPQEAQMVTAKTMVAFDNPIKAPRSIMIFLGVIPEGGNEIVYVPLGMVPEVEASMLKIISSGKVKAGQN